MSRRTIVIAVSVCTAVAVTATSLILANAASGAASQFQVVNGSIRTATGTPKPASGTHASLWSNNSYATTTIAGSGRVLIGAIGDNCDGWPLISVYVNDRHVGDTRPVSATHYGTYPVGQVIAAGTHRVRINFTNDHRTSSCDRNVHLAYARMEQTATPTTAPATTPARTTPPATPTTRPPTASPTRPGGRPGPNNTGVPDGYPLRIHNGDLTITQNGAVVDGLDVRGFVNVRASNVTIRNSILRGRDPGPNSRGSAIISAHGDHTNLVVEDSTLEGAVVSGWLNGITGRNFTVRRVDISRVVDNIMVFGDNVVVRDSWLHGNFHITPWPAQPDNMTHDDNIQFEGGTNILIQNNTMESAYNAALMVTQNWGRSSGIRLIGNYLTGGGCTVNLSEKGKGPITNMLVQDNVFGTSRVPNCGVIAAPTSTPQMVNNIWEATGATVVVRRGA